MIVGVGRGICPCLLQTVVGKCLHEVIKVLIGIKHPLFLIIQTIETHVLLLPRTGCGGESVCLCGLHGNLTPLCGGVTACSIHWHTALVIFLTVAQDVLAHFSEVDIQVATISGGIGTVARIDEGVEQPELHILDVCLLEVVGVQLSHQSSPFLVRLGQ